MLDVIRRENGDPLNAHFSVQLDGDGLAVYLESRGGSAGAPNYRNPDYSEGLWYLLNRLAAQDATLLDATVESKETEHLAHAARRLDLGQPYPLRLSTQDPEDLRLTLQRAQRPIGREPGSGPGGNNTKRIRLLVTADVPAAAELQALLATGGADAVRQATQAVAVVAGRRRGQGFATDTQTRRAIEDRAMALVRHALEREHWEVEDVSRTRSYDFHCRRYGVEQLVEVKGSSASLGEVIVTPNEVRLARERGDMWLAVVSEIAVARSATGRPIARGGVVSWIKPWRIDDGELVPLGYTWRLSSARRE